MTISDWLPNEVPKGSGHPNREKSDHFQVDRHQRHRNQISTNASGDQGPELKGPKSIAQNPNTGQSDSFEDVSDDFAVR